MPRLDRLQAKFDAMAAPQLRAELDRLQQAIDEATSRAEMAETRGDQAPALLKTGVGK